MEVTFTMSSSSCSGGESTAAAVPAQQKAVEGRISFTFPAAIDKSGATAALCQALASPSLTTAPPHVSIMDISKASVTVNFRVSRTSQTPSHDATSSDAIAKQLASASEMLRHSLAKCVMTPHGEGSIGFQRVLAPPPPSTEGDIEHHHHHQSLDDDNKAILSLEEFTSLVDSGLLRIADAALMAGIVEVVRDMDTRALPRAAVHRAMLEVTAKSFYKAVFSEVPVTADSLFGCSRSPSPRPIRHDGTDHEEMCMLRKTCRDVAVETMDASSSHTTSSSASSRVMFDSVASQAKLEMMRLEERIRSLLDELRCIGEDNKQLDAAVSTLTTEKDSAEKTCAVLKKQLDVQGVVLAKREAELTFWRQKAEDADRALQMQDEGGEDAGPEGRSSSSSAFGTGDARLLKLLELRESQVASLNQQLLSARKEIAELGGGRKNSSPSSSSLGFASTISRKDVRVSNASGDCTVNSSRSSSCRSEHSGGLSVSRGSSEEMHLITSNTTTTTASSAVDVVPRSAVLALEERCAAAEAALRERTMQMAVLLKVTKSSAHGIPSA